MSRIFSRILIATMTLAAVVLIVPMFIPWTSINCVCEDVDIRTGRIRISRYLAFCKVSERVEESALSRVLPQEMVEGVKPQWERVNTFSLGLSHSPHHRFHGAIGQIRSIELLWQVATIDESTKQKIASHVLAIWQFDGNYFRAGQYLHGLQGLTDENKRGPLVRTIGALKIPEEHAEGDHLVVTLFYPDGKPMERVQGYRDGRGQFVKHGSRETWHFEGKRESYGHLDHGMHHGLRFDWDWDGKLTTIEKFDHNQIIQYDSQDLEARPEYVEVRSRLGIGSDDRTDRPTVGGKVIPVGLRDASQPGGGASVPFQSADGDKSVKATNDDAVGQVPHDEPTQKPAPLTVHGLVIDASTKRAIPRFRVIPGSMSSPGVTWQPYLITTHRGGRFDLAPNARAWDKTWFRVEAEGYRPRVSRMVEKSEGEVKLTFVLEADAGISAVVRTPEGTPASGAQAAWATSFHEATGHGATITLAVDERYGAKVVTADAEGRFRLPPECDPGMIIVAHDRGYAELRPADVTTTGVVTLRKWGRVEGRVVAGTKPVVGREIQITRHGASNGDLPAPVWAAEAVTNAEGRFICDRVVAGRMDVDRWFPADEGKGTVYGLATTIEVREGQTTQVRLGGPDRVLIGQIKAPKGFELPIDWTKARVHFGLKAPHIGFPGDEEIWKIYGSFVNSEEGAAYSRGNLPVDRDGSFRIEAVPAGEYELTILINGPAVGKPAEVGIRYAMGGTQIQVAPKTGSDDQPQSLGTINLHAVSPKTR